MAYRGLSDYDSYHDLCYDSFYTSQKLMRDREYRRNLERMKILYNTNSFPDFLLSSILDKKDDELLLLLL